MLVFEAPPVTTPSYGFTFYRDGSSVCMKCARTYLTSTYMLIAAHKYAMCMYTSNVNMGMQCLCICACHVCEQYSHTCPMCL